MSDYLDSEVVEESMQKYFPELWPSTSHRALYCQRNAEGSIELFGNKALTVVLPLQMLKAITEQQLVSWVAMLEAIGPLTAVIVAGQDLYATVLSYAQRDNWKARVRRVVRKGDCQANSNFGTDSEQIAATRILANGDSSQRQIAVIEVLGTDLFFFQANFHWDELAYFNLKSCLTLKTLCSIAIPQLVSHKGITGVLFADSATASQVYSVDNMESYSRLFCIAPDPDDHAVAERESLRKALALYPVEASGLTEAIHLVGGWLNAARKRFGLAADNKDDGKSKETDSVTTEKARLLYIFFQLAHTQEVPTIRSLGAELTPRASRDEFTLRLRKALLLIAKAKLGELTAEYQPEIDVFLNSTTENDIWWQPTIVALTHNWVIQGLPDNWLIQLGDRGTAGVLEVARQNQTSYDKIRAEWLRLFVGDEGDFILPFTRFSDEIELGDYYRESQRVIDCALAGELSINKKNISSEQKASMSEMDKIKFYIGFSWFRENYSDQMIRRVLEKARMAWGDSKEQFCAEFYFLMWRDQNIVKAEQCCAAWINSYPDDDAAWYCKGILKINMQHTEEARLCFLHSATLTNNNQAALFEAARCLWRMDNDIDKANAETELRELVDQKEPHPRACALLGLMRFFDNDYAQALIYFRQANVDGIDAERALYPFLLCLLQQEGWAVANKSFEENVDRLNDQELSLYITGATLLLYGTEQGCLIAAHHFSPLLKFEENWKNTIDIVVYCCFKSGDWQKGRELAQRVLASPWGGESHASQLICSYIYTTQARDLAQGCSLAAEFVNRFPESFILCNLAGELSETTGQNGEAFFLRASEILYAVPTEERDEYQSVNLAVALCNLRQFPLAYDIIPENLSEPCHIFTRILISCAAGINCIDEYYSRAKETLLSAESLEVKQALYDHLIDLELYGQRGLIPDWQQYQSIATKFFSGSI
ncbi:TPA: tetratricopeptide repeat protein [Klebsiella variicola]